MSDEQAGQGRRTPAALTPRYERRAPAPQTIADIFAGHWRSKLPGGITSGESDMFADRRPVWVDGVLSGGLQGKRVLELGPFEGYQTYLLEQLGATNIISVESNTINFLKCLCVKEIYGLRASFILGDAAEFVRECTELFDLVWASGMIYHLHNPLAFIEDLGRISRSAFIWTHYFDWDVISEDTVQARHFDASQDRSVTAYGRTIRLHARTYSIGDYESSIPLKWQGGIDDVTFWLEKDDLLFLLEHSGFSSIVIGGVGKAKSLPSISLLARQV